MLEDQAASEAPEPLAPVRKKCEGNGTAETLTLKPGAVRKERWISRAHPSLLDVVGSKHAVARLQVFEPDEKAATVRISRPVSAVAKWKISYPEGRSDGQRGAVLSVVGGGDELEAVSARYERAFLAVGDGKRVQLDAPG